MPQNLPSYPFHLSFYMYQMYQFNKNLTFLAFLVHVVNQERARYCLNFTGVKKTYCNNSVC